MFLRALTLAALVAALCCRSSSVPASYSASSSSDGVEDSLRLLDHAAMTALLRRWAAEHPTVLSLYSVGNSVRGRDLWVVRLSSSDASSSTLPRPAVKCVANMHGDESAGRTVLLALAEFLLKNRATDAEVAKLLGSAELHLMPSMNPDGFEYSLHDPQRSDNNCSSARGRRNANSVDLNRNFPSIRRRENDAEDPERGREPETKLVMRWIGQHPFVLSCNLHGGSVVASYPYDDSETHTKSGYYSKSPDDAVFRNLARTYASNHEVMRSGVTNCPGFGPQNFTDGITNGAFWYDVPGGMQDFNYAYSNCFEVTLELTCCKFVPEDQLKLEWLRNKRPMLEFLKKVHMGVKGVVTAAGTGRPIKGAVIKVEHIDKSVKTTDAGEYWRLLVAGVHNMTVTAEGYQSQTTEITIPENCGYSAVIRNFSLTPVPASGQSPDGGGGGSDGGDYPTDEILEEYHQHVPLGNVDEEEGDDGVGCSGSED